MEQLLTRRNLFEVLGGGAAIIAAEQAVVKKAPAGEITDEVLARIQERSRELISHIIPFTFENPALSDMSLNRAAIAKSLLSLAFLDGREEEVEQVAKFIIQVGLIFKLSDFEESDNDETVGSMIPSVNNSSIIVRLYSPDMELYRAVKKLNQPEDQHFLDGIDQLILHELDHVVQQARDPEKFHAFNTISRLAIPVAVSAPGVAIIHDLVARGISRRFLSNEEENRREFTKSLVLNVTQGTVAALTTLPLFNYLYKTHDVALFEQRAELQAQRLFDNPSFAHLRGQFIT